MRKMILSLLRIFFVYSFISISCIYSQNIKSVNMDYRSPFGLSRYPFNKVTDMNKRKENIVRIIEQSGCRTWRMDIQYAWFNKDLVKKIDPFNKIEWIQKNLSPHGLWTWIFFDLEATAYPFEKMKSIYLSDISSSWNSEYGYAKTIYFATRDILENSFLAKGIKPVGVNFLNEAGPRIGKPEDYVKCLCSFYKAVKDVSPDILVTDSGLSSGCNMFLIIKDFMDKKFKKDWSAEQAWDFFKAYTELFSAESGAITEMDGEDKRVGRLLGAKNLDELKQGMTDINQINRIINFRLRYLEAISGETHPAVDFINFHFYEKWSVMPVVVEYFKWKSGQKAAGSTELGMRRGAVENAIQPASDYHGYLVFKKLVESLAMDLKIIGWYHLSHWMCPTDKIGLIEDSTDRILPAYKAYSTVSTKISDKYRFVNDSTTQDHVRVFVFRDASANKENLRALWWQDGFKEHGSSSFSLPVPEGLTQVKMISCQGDEKILNPENNALNLTVTEEPFFLEW
jgi:hypothetical protein